MSEYYLFLFGKVFIYRSGRLHYTLQRHRNSNTKIYYLTISLKYIVVRDSLPIRIRMTYMRCILFHGSGIPTHSMMKCALSFLSAGQKSNMQQLFHQTDQYINQVNIWYVSG